MIGTEDRGRQTALEDRVRAREACPWSVSVSVRLQHPSTATPQNRNSLRAPFPNSQVS